MSLPARPAVRPVEAGRQARNLAEERRMQEQAEGRDVDHEHQDEDRDPEYRQHGLGGRLHHAGDRDDEVMPVFISADQDREESTPGDAPDPCGYSLIALRPRPAGR